MCEALTFCECRWWINEYTTTILNVKTERYKQKRLLLRMLESYSDSEATIENKQKCIKRFKFKPR
jgi:hypothetical protein